MQIIADLMSVCFGLFLAALAVTPGVIGVYIEFRVRLISSAHWVSWSSGEETMKLVSTMDETLFSVAMKAYHHQCRANGFMDEEPSKGASSQEGNVVVLRNAHRELARYRILERGGRPRLRFAESKA